MRSSALEAEIQDHEPEVSPGEHEIIRHPGLLRAFAVRAFHLHSYKSWAFVRHLLYFRYNDYLMMHNKLLTYFHQCGSYQKKGDIRE